MMNSTFFLRGLLGPLEGFIRRCSLFAFLPYGPPSPLGPFLGLVNIRVETGLFLLRFLGHHFSNG